MKVTIDLTDNQVYFFLNQWERPPGKTPPFRRDIFDLLRNVILEKRNENGILATLEVQFDAAVKGDTVEIGSSHYKPLGEALRQLGMKELCLSYGQASLLSINVIEWKGVTLQVITEDDSTLTTRVKRFGGSSE